MKGRLTLNAIKHLLSFYKEQAPELLDEFLLKIIDVGIAELIESKQFGQSDLNYLFANHILKEYFVLSES